MQLPVVLIPLLPLAGALLLGVPGRRLPSKTVAFIGCGSVGLCALACLLASLQFLASPPPGHAYTQQLWAWMSIGAFHPEISLRLDALSLVMSLVVSVVSFLIHVYSVEFMRGEDGYSRFFSCMNLFVASMLILVLAEDLLFLYLGWEGVGLCSYLLIGFWYKDPANGHAARKAFLITRIGDTAMAIGLFVLFTHLGTSDIQALLERAAQQWRPGSGLAIAAAALLLGGALGKSAQLPLQTWLPDAMAGPAPVSALIHAATMVTAGVYLIARVHPLFELAPPVQRAVAIIGAATLVVSALSALAQTDIKRVLAYSTISQVGYMFLALGVGAWPAAIFHFMTHAFFKALLFLGAGAVILALRREHDIFKMGGLRKTLPWVFWTFLVGAASLSALPWVTAGFYSKDLILTETFSAARGGVGLWAAGLAGALLTSLYSFRLVFVVFFGEPRSPVAEKPGRLIRFPLACLAGLSLVSGFAGIPHFLGAPEPSAALHSWLPLAAPLASVAGIALACVLWLRPPRALGPVAARLAPVRRFLRSGWGFDGLYDLIFRRPFVLAAKINRDDFIDLFFDGVARVSLTLNRWLGLSQTGRLRWYAAVLGAGTAVLIVLAEVL